MRLRLITPPTVEPITLSTAKDHLRVTHDLEDDLINGLIMSARDLCERETGRALMPQTWELALSGFDDVMDLSIAPIISITSVKYTDSAGAEQTFPVTEYVLDNAGQYIAAVALASGKSWPTVHAGINTVRIRFQAGYADAASVPPALKQWMLLQISHWYRNRESVNVGNIVSEMPFACNLLNAYRIYSI